MVKTLAKVIGIVLALSVMFVLANVVMICSTLDPVETLVQKLRSDNDLEAVLVRREAGATVSTSYCVRLNRPGSGEKGVDVLLIDRVSEPEKIRLSWDGPDLRVNLPSDYQVIKKTELVSVAGASVRVIYRTTPKTD